jgi:serine/threonine protein kinase
MRDDDLSARETRIATAEPASGEIRPGTVLFGAYEVVEMLGRGGMGAVYRARHLSLGGERAIKVIRPELSHERAALELFIREARALLEVQHDAVVRCHDLLRDEAGRVVLVMEMVEGVPLSERLHEGPLAPDEVRALRDRLGAGLAAAHQRGVIHRDLSPDNVLLPDGRAERAKLIDFGIAKEIARGDATIAAGFKGKLAYASPEQLGLFGGRVDTRSDLYSLGLVLLEAASGERLPMGRTLAEAIDTRRGPPPVPAGIPADLRREIEPLLAPDPADRPYTAEPSAAEALPPPRVEPRRRALLPAGLALAVVLAGLTIWLLPRVRAPAPPREEPPGTESHDTRPETPLEIPETVSFGHARQALFEATGTWAEAAPRLRIDPDPVEDGAPYTVSFEAACDCVALLFSINETEDAIQLLFPNRFEPARRLRSGEPLRIPSAPLYQLKAEGGEGTDWLKLVVAREGIEFPPDGTDAWSATRDAPERVAELVWLLDRLREVDWASARAPLRIREGSGSD